MKNLQQIQQELTDICGEKIHNTSPDYFKDAVNSLNRETILESARKFGTPQYLLNLDRLRERAIFFSHTMRHHIPNSEFFYAFKCNDLPLQVKTLEEEGFQADVAGIFELQLALKLGFERILFSGPGKSAEELKLALKKRKQVIVNIDNFDEIHRLKALAGNKKSSRPLAVGFRLNVEATIDGAWSKFGFELEELKEAVRLVRQCPNLLWTGLHFHCSWNKTPKKYLDNIKRIAIFLKENFSNEELRGLKFFDIGGGFYPEDQGIINKCEDKGMLLDILGTRRGSKLKIYEEMDFDPSAFSITPVEPLENFGRAIASALQEYIFPLNPEITIYFEPGRFIATHATTILLTVMAIKKNCVIVDGGINMLGDYKFAEYSFAPMVNITRPSTQLRKQVIYGSLCDPADLWAYSYYGEELQKGDTLAVLNQGAYTFCTAWRFIKPIPAYIAASGNHLTIAKKSEKFQSRYAGCRHAARAPYL
jgi:diaminopimelate decarboxylase